MQRSFRIIDFDNKKSNNDAKKFRKMLLKKNYSTKILPEATSWHFAGKWEHIKELKIKNSHLVKSNKILSKCVSIPIFYKMKKFSTNYLQYLKKFSYKEFIIKSIQIS